MLRKRKHLQKEKWRERTRAVHRRAKQAGWVKRGLWVREEWIEKVAQESSRLGVNKRNYWCAVFEVGTKLIRPTDVVMSDQRWHEWAGFPRCQQIREHKIQIERDPLTGRIIRQVA